MPGWKAIAFRQIASSCGRDRRHQHARRRKLARLHLGDDLGGILRREGKRAREQFIKRRTQAVDVAGRPQLLERPRACSGLMYEGVPIVVPGWVSPPTLAPGSKSDSLSAFDLHRHDIALADPLGQPPVHDECFTILTQHDIAGFEVAMDHATAVGILHRIADVEKAPQQLLKLDPPGRAGATDRLSPRLPCGPRGTA